MKEEKEKNILIKATTIFGVVIALWFFIRGYFVEGFINPNIPIDNDISAKIGDFIGGVIGTIFAFVSVLLLFKTLSLQRIELKESRKVFTKQQFENSFFELLKIHKNNLREFEDFDLLNNKLIGIKYLEYKQNKLQDNFINTKRFSKNRKLAIQEFEKIYVQKSHVFSTYFRTLFRLYCLIEEGTIKNSDKINYSKILRAQISEPELFFIRYNAMSEYGYNSQKYINSFNILKQLSNFDLLEFKYWWNKLDNYERNGLGTLFKQVKQEAKKLLKDIDSSHYEATFTNGRYKIQLISENKGSFKLSIIRDNNRTSNQLSIANGFDKMKIKDIKNLLKCILKELFVISNFNKLNERQDIIIDGDFFIKPNFKEEATSIIKNKYLIPLKINHWDK
jgi:hypothetical protein